jgi:hypothetical protein
MRDSDYAIDLCANVLSYAAFSSPVTGDKTPAEIKCHLSKIFPEHVIDSAVASFAVSSHLIHPLEEKTKTMTKTDYRSQRTEPLAQKAYVAFVQICKGGSDDAGTYDADEAIVRRALKRLDELEGAALAEPCVAPNECPGLEAAIAADLRAAADRARRGPEHWEGSYPDDYDKGWNEAVDYFTAIAAELEAR